MNFTATSLEGAFLIERERFDDERGYFARIWCEREFRDHGLNPAFVQSNVSYNRLTGTLRGMHFQAPPHQESKLVRCTRGRIFDAMIDLRNDSPTFLKSLGVELSSDKGNMLYIPEGFAHGFLTLEDDSEIEYHMTAHYHPDAGRGVRWNDPVFGIDWPETVRVINERDATYPDYVSK